MFCRKNLYSKLLSIPPASSKRVSENRIYLIWDSLKKKVHNKSVFRAERFQNQKALIESRHYGHDAIMSGYVWNKFTKHSLLKLYIAERVSGCSMIINKIYALLS